MMPAGTVWAWGNNSREDGVEPRPLEHIEGATGVSFNGASWYVTTADGSVWACGRNDWGQLGDGTTSDRLMAIRVPGLKSIVKVVADERGAYALSSDGTVWAWGYNEDGRLGDGTKTDRLTPVPVSGLTNVKMIFGSLVQTYMYLSNVYAVKSDGTVWQWGRFDDVTPVQVPTLTRISALAPTKFTSYALDSDGTVWAWNDDDLNPMGDGPSEYGKTPVRLSNLTSIVALETDGGYNFALRSDGTVWAWGKNFKGELGVGGTSPQLQPVRLSGLADITALSTSGRSTYALRRDGTVWSWGENAHGQLGNGTTAAQPAPVKVAVVSDIVAIMSLPFTMPGSNIFDSDYLSAFAYALRSDGTVWAWGDNRLGQLGFHLPKIATEPSMVPEVSGVANLAVGPIGAIAITGELQFARPIPRVENRDSTTGPTVSDRAPQKSGCYIATAVYGSYDCPPVLTLRRYRDQRLAKTALGRTLIRVYYAASPALVRRHGDRLAVNRPLKGLLDIVVRRLRANGY